MSKTESSSESGHSPYYRTFLRRASLRRRSVSTGYDRLDELLGGGLQPGLHLVSGAQATMQRAFVDNLVWGAVQQNRSCWYGAFDTGAQTVWERMVVTLGSLLGEPIRPDELDASTGSDGTADRVGRIDAALVRTVLPYVCLRDTDVNGHVSLTRFMGALTTWLARENNPRLLIIDSFCGLSSLVSNGDDHADQSRLAAELDHFLKKGSAAAVATLPAEPDVHLAEDGFDVVQLRALGATEDGTEERLLVASHGAGGIRADVFVVDGVTGLFG